MHLKYFFQRQNQVLEAIVKNITVLRTIFDETDNAAFLNNLFTFHIKVIFLGGRL
jgi:hypothetical protein